MRLLRKLRSGQSSSRNIAKERLQLVLVHDRAEISPGLMEKIKDDIISVISKHIPIERDAVGITFTQTGRETRLQADIPLTRQRQRPAR
jgi:cell division topological specificity factor